jgi:hypothetical protein
MRRQTRDLTPLPDLLHGAALAGRCGRAGLFTVTCSRRATRDARPGRTSRCVPVMRTRPPASRAGTRAPVPGSILRSASSPWPDVTGCRDLSQRLSVRVRPRELGSDPAVVLDILLEFGHEFRGEGAPGLADGVQDVAGGHLLIALLEQDVTSCRHRTGPAVRQARRFGLPRRRHPTPDSVPAGMPHHPGRAGRPPGSAPAPSAGSFSSPMPATRTASRWGRTGLLFRGC